MSFMNSINQSTTLNGSEQFTEDMSSRVPKIVFLLLLTVSGLVGNSLLLMVLLRGKKSVLNIMIINLCVVGLCECWVNMSIMFATLVSGKWMFGDAMCKVNAFSNNVVLVEWVLTVLCLSIERFISMKHLTSSNSCLTIRRMFLILAYTWIHSIAFTLPLLASTIPTTFHTDFHACAIADSASLAYICTTTAVCFLAPIAIILVLYALLIKDACTGRFNEISMVQRNQFTEKHAKTSDIQQEINTSRFVGVVIIALCVLCLPHIVTSFNRQYQNSLELQIKNGNSQSLVNQPWSVDLSVVYLRFLFTAVWPVLTFVFISNLWFNLKDLILCHRSNSIADVVQSKKKSDKAMKKQSVNGLVVRDSVNSPNNPFFNVPVLFATSDGMHVEFNNRDNNVDSKVDKVEKADVSLKSKSVTSKTHIPVGKACDVGPSEYCPPDTSDYDSSSEADVFSSSQPVSMRLATQEILTHRSLSQPEVHTNKCRTTSLKDQVFGTDSGLDLSVSGSNRLPKGKEKFENTSTRTEKTTACDAEEIPITRDYQKAYTTSAAKTPPIEHEITEVKSSQATNTESNQNEADSIEAQYLQSFDKESPRPSGREKPDGYLTISQRVKNKQGTERDFPQLNSKDDCRTRGADESRRSNGHNSSVTDLRAPASPGPPPISNSLPPKYPNYISLAGEPCKKSQTKSRHSDTKLVNLGETFDIGLTNLSNRSSGEATVPKTQPVRKSSMKTKGHQRHDTDDSQKALLGSGSSCELNSLKAETFPSGDTHLVSEKSSNTGEKH